MNFDFVPKQCPCCGETKFYLTDAVVRQTTRNEYFHDFVLKCQNCNFVMKFTQEINRVEFYKRIRDKQFANFHGKFEVEAKEKDLKIEGKEDKLKKKTQTK